ncbi:MAG: hypothetical protein R2838_09415 [Caldilineaceae bacterium]
MTAPRRDPGVGRHRRRDEADLARQMRSTPVFWTTDYHVRAPDRCVCRPGDPG